MRRSYMIDKFLGLLLAVLLGLVLAGGYWLGKNSTKESQVIGTFESPVPNRENKLLWADRSEDYVPGEGAITRSRTDI